MGYKLIREEDIKKREALKKKQEKQQKAQNRREKVVYAVAAFVESKFAKVLALCFAIGVIAIVAKDFKVKNLMKFAGLVDWSQTKVSEEDLDTTGVDVIEGLIGFDKYLEYRKESARTQLDDEKEIFTDAIYNNLLDGIESEYFYDSIQADYLELCKSALEFVEQERWIEALYDAYENDIGIGSSRVYKCMCPAEGETECEMKTFIDTFTQGELKQYLDEQHTNWESLTNYRKPLVKVTDDYMNLYYQEYLCTNYDYLDKLDVEVMVIGSELFNQGAKAVENAVKKGKIEVKHLNKFSNKKALDGLYLYSNMDFYDAGFDKLTADTITALFSDTLVNEESVQYLGSDLSEEEIIDKIKNGGIKTATASEISETEESEESNFLEQYSCLTFNLTGRSEADVYYILYKINDCKHNLDIIKSYNEMYNELLDKAKALEAQKDISDIITAEIEDLDVEDLDPDTTKQIFGDLGEEEKEEEVIELTPEEFEERVNSDREAGLIDEEASEKAQNSDNNSVIQNIIDKNKDDVSSESTESEE